MKIFLESHVSLYYKDANLTRPILHTLVECGCVEAVKAVMQDPRKLDLSVQDNADQTVFHVALSDCPAQAARDILQTLVDRVANVNLTTLTAWERDGAALVDVAVFHGRLSLLCKVLVPAISYYNDKPQGHFQLKQKLQEEDWNAMKDLGDHQGIFLTVEQRQSDEEEKKKSQEALNESLWGSQWVTTASDVIRLVKRGADVMYMDKATSLSWLTKLLLDGRHSSVLGALMTANAIDFTVADHLGNTFLHYLYPLQNAQQRGGFGQVNNDNKNNISEATASLILHAVITHMETHPQSRIDWGKKNRNGDEYVSVVAKHEWLAGWWDVVSAREVPYYMNPRSQPIRLTYTIKEKDWINLQGMRINKPEFILAP